MKVMVVDDEKEIREYIANMQEWKEIGCEVVGVAANGAEAYRLIHQLNPDVLLTDIRMPVMDGIELAERVKKERPELPIIFLTAYSDFEYAKKAIKIGVTDFITKPFQPEDLINSVRLLRNFVHHRKELVWQDEIFAQLRDPNLTDEMKDQWLDDRNIEDKDFILFYVEIDNSHMHFHLNQPFSRLVLKEKIDHLLNGSAFSYWADLSHMGIYFILFSEGGDLMESAADEVMDLARKSTESFGDSEFSISIGFSRKLDSLLQLTEGVRQIGKCMEYRMLLGRKSIIAYDSLEHLSAERGRSNEVSQNELSFLLHKGDIPKIGDFLKETYRKMLTDGFSKKDVQHFSLQIIDIVEKVLGEYNIETLSDKRVDIREKVLSYDILTDLLQFLKAHLIYVVKLIEEKKDNHSSLLIAETQRMIKEQYKEDLTLQKIAEMLHVNYSYLSRMIKKETNKNFRDLLWEYRIEAAKTMLAQSELRSYEIAYAVGCKDPAHFSELFKKMTGLSPMDYKEEVRGKK